MLLSFPNAKHFKTLSSYIKQMSRKVSTRTVCELENVNRAEFSKAKKQFELNLEKTVNYCNSLSSEKKNLVFDYVLINQKMEIIDKPYNWTFDYTTRKMGACIVLLVAGLATENEFYPLAFDYWFNKNFTEKDQIYLKKTELAELMFDEITNCNLTFQNTLIDAGFCSPNFLKFIDSKGFKFIVRFPKNRNFIINNETYNSKSIFAETPNGQFYFDTVFGFTKFVCAEYSNIKCKIVFIADSKDKLVNRDFYCLITNDLNIMYTQVVRQYKNRGKIEFFSKY